MGNAGKLNSFGARLRAFRAYANFSRKDIAERHGISEMSFRSWEFDQVKNITEKHLERILAAFDKEGYSCSKEWLLFGRGPSPFADPSNKSFDPKDPIASERTYFEASNPNSISMVLEEDYIPSHLEKGDVIGGILIPNNSEKGLSPFIGKTCLIITESDKAVCGLLQKSGKKDCVSIQKNLTFQRNSLLYDVKPLKIYEVVWIRRKKRK